MFQFSKQNGNEVLIHVRNEEVCKSICEENVNCHYLTEFKLPPNITASTDPRASLENADFILHTIPVQVSLMKIIYISRVSSTFKQSLPLFAQQLQLSMRPRFDPITQLIPINDKGTSHGNSRVYESADSKGIGTTTTHGLLLGTFFC